MRANKLKYGNVRDFYGHGTGLSFHEAVLYPKLETFTDSMVAIGLDMPPSCLLLAFAPRLGMVVETTRCGRGHGWHTMAQRAGVKHLRS